MKKALKQRQRGRMAKMRINDLRNKKIAVWGLGAEGQQAVKYLSAHGIAGQIILFNDTEIEKPEGCRDFDLVCGDRIAAALDRAEVIIRSPGVSIYREELTEAKRRGIAVTSVTDLCLSEFLSRPGCRVIGVSGSKGKSTSVSVLAYILQKSGYKVGLGGNIGKPMIELLDQDYDFIVEEFSSYQASDLTASPQIAMFTNLFYVHTDWHRGHENYCRDKIHLIANQQPGDVYFANRRNPQSVEYTEAYAENRRWYNEAALFHAENGVLYHGEEKLAEIGELKLNGNHNMDNLAGVFSVLDYLGIDLHHAAEILKDFEPLPHRLQKVAVKDGVTFINDSISTAPEAAIGAVGSFTGNLALISGGQDNCQDYGPYAETIENNSQVKMVVTLYQTGPKIAAVLRKGVRRVDFELVETDTLENAVKTAYAKLKKLGGGTILFSPTSPSFGFYKNFIERGNHFIKIVQDL